MAHVVDTTIAAVKMTGDFASTDFSSSEDEQEIYLGRPRSNAVSQSDADVSGVPQAAFIPRFHDNETQEPASCRSRVEQSPQAYQGDLRDEFLWKTTKIESASGQANNRKKAKNKTGHTDTSSSDVPQHESPLTDKKVTASSPTESHHDRDSSIDSSHHPVTTAQINAGTHEGQSAVDELLSTVNGTSSSSGSSLRELYHQSRFNPFDRDIHLEEDHFSDGATANFFGHQSSSPMSVQSSNPSEPWQDGGESDDVTFAELGLAEDHFAHPEGHFGLSRTEELELAINNCKELIQSAAQNSDRQKNLIRKLVQLRLKLQEIKEGPEPEETDKMVVMGHRFQRKESRSSKYYCEKCNSLIWGVLQEWRRCTECGYRCHDKCVSQITRTCASVKVKENPTFILELCPRNPKGLAAQEFRCAECRAQISGSDGPEARLCEYNGRYYCELCHWNDLVYIPAQILHNWDFEKRKVCRASKQFLKLMMKRAVIRVQDVNPLLFNYVEQLSDIKNLREEVLIMKKYIMACPAAMKAKLLLQLSSRPHFVECSDRYSLQDLLDSDDALIPDLVQVHSSWAQHIKTDCELCQGRGFICELCTSNEVLFPFDNIAVVCSCCSSVMHRICFAQKVMCPKCERRKKRKEQEEIKGP